MVRDAGAAGERLPPQVTLRVADYEDISALRSALAGADQMILISSDGNARAVMRHHANVISATLDESLPSARLWVIRYNIETPITATTWFGRSWPKIGLPASEV